MNEEIVLKTDTIFPSEYEKYVSIYNIGNDDLVISAIYASCGCTTFTISKDTIPPNDSAALFVKINLSTASGDKQNHVYLTSNDPKSPKTDVLLNVFVYRDLLSKPQKLPSFSNVESGSIITYNIVLLNSSKQDIEIQNPESADNSSFEVVSVQPLDNIIPKNSSREYKIKIKLSPKNLILSKMIIRTNSKSVPKLEYTIMVSSK